MKKAVDDNGRMLCHRERRLNRAAQHDIIGVIESWLLTVDTYGSEAIEQVRDHLRYGLAYFVDTNPKQAIPKLLKVVDRAEALGARITYAYSIERPEFAFSTGISPVFAVSAGIVPECSCGTHSS